jgi:hypothetical protein
MLTIFSTPKPFRGHINVIQRNAIQSWKRIDSKVEIILFGDEEGTAEAAREFTLVHVPNVPKNEHGTKLLSGFFEPAQRMARFDLLCYINCDIMMLPSFSGAIERATTSFPQFLMVGQRWNTDVLEPWNFSHADWDKRLESFVSEHGSLLDETGIDYFAFRRGLYQEIPALVIGRIWWDHWLIWRARSLGTPVVNATQVVKAVHQNHDYSYHPAGASGVWQDEQAKKNYELAGGSRHLYTIADSTHRLTSAGIRRNPLYFLSPLRRATRPYIAPAWYRFLGMTRTVRHSFGLRRDRAQEPGELAAGNSRNRSEAISSNPRTRL